MFTINQNWALGNSLSWMDAKSNSPNPNNGRQYLVCIEDGKDKPYFLFGVYAKIFGAVGWYAVDNFSININPILISAYAELEIKHIGTDHEPENIANHCQ